MILSTFKYTCWPFVYLLCKNIYSVPLPIFPVKCLVSYHWVVDFFFFFFFKLFHSLTAFGILVPWPELREKMCSPDRRPPANSLSCVIFKKPETKTELQQQKIDELVTRNWRWEKIFFLSSKGLQGAWGS